MEASYEIRGAPLNKREKIALLAALIEYAKRMDETDSRLADCARALASEIKSKPARTAYRPP